MNEPATGNGGLHHYKRQQREEASAYPARTLADYRPAFINPQYPILSFLYAVLAGGEAPLHFDFTDEFNKAYLLDPFGGDIERCPAHVRLVLDRLKDFEARAEKRTRYVPASAEDIDTFLDALGFELKTAQQPRQVW